MSRKLLNDELKIYFHKKLIKRRAELGLTQAAMAQRLVMDTRSYIELDHGKSRCSALTLALFLIYLCKTPESKEEFLKGLESKFNEILKENSIA